MKNIKYILMKPSVYFIGLILFWAILLVSCGTARRSEPIMGKMAMNEEIKKGEHVFMENCQKCHPGGEAGVGPPINNVPIPDPLMRFRVRSRAFALGIGRMPSFKEHEISDKELDHLIVYLKALKKNDEDAHGSKKGNSNYAKNEKENNE